MEWEEKEEGGRRRNSFSSGKLHDFAEETRLGVCIFQTRKIFTANLTNFSWLRRILRSYLWGLNLNSNNLMLLVYVVWKN